jgi:hypothetical protein
MPHASRRGRAFREPERGTACCSGSAAPPPKAGGPSRLGPSRPNVDFGVRLVMLPSARANKPQLGLLARAPGVQ